MTLKYETYTVKLEIDWANDGYTGADDMSAYLLDWSYNIGIDQPLLDARVASVGEMSLTLRNTDKRFSPLNASGPYYGNLRNRRPVRLSVTSATGTYTLFVGKTKRIEPTNGSGTKRERQVSIECVDTMRQIQRENVAIPLFSSADTTTILKAVVNHCLVAPIATQTIELTANPANNDTLTINGTVLTYKTTLSGASDEIHIESTVQDTMQSTANAINRAGGAGTRYASNMSYQNFVRSSAPQGELQTQANNNATVAIGNVGGSDIWTAQSFTPAVGGILKQFTFTLDANSGSPSGTMTWEIRNDSSGLPGATILNTGTLTPTASALNTVTITGGAILAVGTKYWILLRSTSAQALNVYWTWQYYNVDLFAGGNMAQTANGGGSYDNFTAFDAKFSVTLASIITVSSTVRGAYGNTLTLAKSSANITLGGATLTGGVDYPASPTPSYESALRSYSYAGDQWSFSNTNGIRAIQDLMDSEWGVFWCSHNGAPTFKNGDYLFRAIIQTPKITFGGEVDLTGAVDEDLVTTRVTVTYTPRGTLAAGVVAKSQGQIVVPGTSGGVRYNPSEALPSNAVTVKLPFVDPTSGQKMGASSIITPLVGGTDYTANEFADFTGVSYTNSPSLSFSIAITGNAVEITITNTALGNLYINGLQVRGTGITMYNTINLTAEDSTKWADLGKLTHTHTIPLPTDQNYVAMLAQYLLARYSTPIQRLEKISIDNMNLFGGISVFNVDLGDVAIVSDTQIGFSSVKCLITGIKQSGDQAGNIRTEFTVYPLDDTVYLILDDTTYGKLDGPGVLAI